MSWSYDRPLNSSRRGGRRLQRRRLLVLVLMLVAVVFLSLGAYLGQRAAYSGMGLDVRRYRELEAALPEARRQLADKQGRIELLSTRREVDREALELVRKELAEQKEQIAALEEGLRFYRSLMAPEEIAQGLSLRGPRLVQLDERRYAFRIVAQQEARKHQTLQGRLYAEVRGTEGEGEVSYPLSELSDDIEEDLIDLRFRYFQPIEGTLVLPEGFEPASIILVATSTMPNRAEVRKQFPWQVGDRLSGMLR